MVNYFLPRTTKRQLGPRYNDSLADHLEQQATALRSSAWRRSTVLSLHGIPGGYFRMTAIYDYIIIGGGTAGCVVARRLADRASARVLLLEAGGPYRAMTLGTPLPGMREMTRFSWKYFTAQQEGLAGRRLSMPLGKLLGGSSSINAMIYCRGSRWSYDQWAHQGHPAWSFAGLLPYFKRLERCHGTPCPWQGDSGPFDVSEPRHLAPFSRAFVEACLETGIPLNPNFNGETNEGTGFFQVSQRRGRRVSAATAYLNRAPAGLTILTGAAVQRIVLEGRRAVAVDYSHNGAAGRAAAEGEIVLCAGAVNTPKLLMLSGAGPAEELRRFGILPVVDLPGVGQNLQDHVRVPVLYESGRPSPGEMRYWVPAAIQYAVTRRGVMASNCCEAGAYVRSSPDEPAPDIQFVTHFQSSLYPGTVDLQFCLARVDSRGSVRLRSADPSAPPVIDPCYLAEASDIKRALAGLRLARRIARARSLAAFPLHGEILPGSDLESDRELVQYIRAAAETNYHPVGTCRMGQDAGSVVDGELRVHGLEGLRIADASVMPEITDGNTMAPVLAIAERAADLILGRSAD